MSGSRRRFFQDAAILGAGIFSWSASAAAHAHSDSESKNHARQDRSAPEKNAYLPMVSPDVPDLPFEMDGDVKVFHLKAEVFAQKIAPFKTIHVWGYNGSCPGPTI